MTPIFFACAAVWAQSASGGNVKFVVDGVKKSEKEGGSKTGGRRDSKEEKDADEEKEEKGEGKIEGEKEKVESGKEKGEGEKGKGENEKENKN